EECEADRGGSACEGEVHPRRSFCGHGGKADRTRSRGRNDRLPRLPAGEAPCSDPGGVRRPLVRADGDLYGLWVRTSNPEGDAAQRTRLASTAVDDRCEGRCQGASPVHVRAWSCCSNDGGPT